MEKKSQRRKKSSKLPSRKDKASVPAWQAQGDLPEWCTNLHKLRLERGYTRTQVGVLAGVDKKFATLIERFESGSGVITIRTAFILGRVYFPGHAVKIFEYLESISDETSFGEEDSGNGETT